MGRNLDVVRSVQGEMENELQVRVRGCDEGELAVFRRVGGDAAREWSSGRPAGLVEWAVADDFWVEVQYPLGYEKIAVRSRTEGVLERKIEFDFDDAALGKREEGTLREVGEFLRGNAGIEIIIEGHTDDRGGKKYNEELGLKRARAAQRFLIDEGIERTRMVLVSCGKRMPLVRIVPSMPSEAHAANRRVEFRIAVPWTDRDAM